MDKTFNTNKGIDISCWQEGIDLVKAKSEGIEYAILRSGFATTEDSAYMGFGKDAKKAGLEIAGIYNFSYATSDKEATAEGKFAVSQARRLGLSGKTPIFYDFEYESIDWCEKHGVALTAAKVQRWTTLFLEEVKKGGYTPGIYLNYDILSRFYTKEIIKAYTIWIAYWTMSDTPDDIDYTFWQTGSEHGIGGFDGKVDTNFRNVKIKMEEKKTVDEIVQEVIAGKWSNGDERKTRLTMAGYNYDEIQTAVNEALSKCCAKKSIEEIAKEVVIGDWGNGLERVKRLTEAGYDPREVQDMVNKKYY